MTCPHLFKAIDGIYQDGTRILGVAWTCLQDECRTSGMIPWEKATDPDRAEALMKHYAKASPEMAAWGGK